MEIQNSTIIERIKSIWKIKTGKIAITFVGLLLGLSLIDSIFPRIHNTAKGYPTDYVCFVPLDMEKYKAEFPNTRIGRITGEIKTDKGIGQIFEIPDYKKTELYGYMPPHVNTLGYVFSVKSYDSHSIYEKLPLYLKKNGFKRVEYTGKYYTGFKPPEEYSNRKYKKKYQKETIDYAGYRKRGVEGPIIKLRSVVFNDKYYDKTNDERSYSVSFITEDGIERNRTLPPGSVVSEGVYENDIVEVRWLGNTPVFCKLD